MTIISTILNSNPTAVAVGISNVWNIHKCKFTTTTQAYKDANVMSMKLASTPICEFDIYAIAGAHGRSAHSKSDIVLIAVKKDDDINTFGRKTKHLISVRNG